jgi:hypothetical protein
MKANVWVACLACVQLSAASARAAEPDGHYDRGPQAGAAVGGGVLGATVGLGVGTLVGFGGLYLSALLEGHSPGVVGYSLLVGSATAGTMWGATWGASAATVATGGPAGGEVTEAAAWSGAWWGAAIGGLSTGALMWSMATTPWDGDLNVDGAMVGLAFYLVPLGVGLGAGFGAAAGYRSAYIERVTLVPTLTPDRVGVSLGFTF